MALPEMAAAPTMVWVAPSSGVQIALKGWMLGKDGHKSKDGVNEESPVVY